MTAPYESAFWPGPIKTSLSPEFHNAKGVTGMSVPSACAGTSAIASTPCAGPVFGSGATVAGEATPLTADSMRSSTNKAGTRRTWPPPLRFRIRYLQGKFIALISLSASPFSSAVRSGALRSVPNCSLPAAISRSVEWNPTNEQI